MGGDNYGDAQQPAGGYADAGVGGADAPPSYGDLQNPASPYQKKGSTAPPPRGVFEQVKLDLKAINKSLQEADLFDMRLHRNHDEFKLYIAWTNDAKSIYFNLRSFEDNFDAGLYGKRSDQWTDQEFKNNMRLNTLAAVAHEIEHVIQFKGNHGHPKTFPKMIEFEVLAYGSMSAFLADGGVKTILRELTGATKDFLDFLATNAKEGLDSIAAMRKITDNDEAQRQLIAAGSLPATLSKAHVAKGKLYTMDDLYKAR